MPQAHLILERRTKISVKKRPIWIPVSTGIIVSDDKVLIGMRPKEKNLPGLWEFPGGKIELGESPEQALARELEEELGITSKADKLLMAVTHDYSGAGILLLFYLVKFWQGEPKNLHHQEIKWVKWSELANYDLPEANKKVLPDLTEFVKKSLA